LAFSFKFKLPFFLYVKLILSTDKGATLELPKDDVTKTISAILKKQEGQWLLTVLSGE